MAQRSCTRREFLSTTAACGAFLGGGLCFAGEGWLASLLAKSETLGELLRASPEARFWVSTLTAKAIDDCRACHEPKELEGRAEYSHEHPTVRCQLCAQECLIPEGERGRCRARINVEGRLRSLVYGRPVSVHVDPIEKKPFYHFLPASAAFSLATAGCPLSCKFCQNWEISQASPEDFPPSFVSAEKVVGAAPGRKAPVIAFTYNEPTVFTEYLIDIARAAREEGLRSVLISCGFMTEKPLAEMCEALDAIKIDLKGFSSDFYRRVCGAELEPVLRSIKQVAASGTHLELVNLVVPTLNDSPEMLTELAKWVVGEVGPDVPIHFTRFHPDYQMLHLSPTPVATLVRAREIAMQQGVRYAFVGNVPGHPGNNTYCPECGRAVIERTGFFIRAMHLEQGRCKFCQTVVRGVWR